MRVSLSQAGAVLKLAYLQMFGMPMDWSAFNCIECMSNPFFRSGWDTPCLQTPSLANREHPRPGARPNPTAPGRSKRIGYLGAPSTPIVISLLRLMVTE